MRNRALWLGLAAGLVMMSVGSVVQSAEEANAPKVPDYGRGFGQFYKLGLPDVTGGRYVALQVYANDVGEMYFFTSRMKLKGNAWLLEEDEEGASTLVYQDTRVLRVLDRDAEVKRQAQKVADTNDTSRVGDLYSIRDDGAVVGSWQDVDVEKDIKAAATYLKEKAAGTDGRELDWDLREGMLGQLFLKAAQFYRAGYTNEANLMAADIFALVPDRKIVLFQSISLLADQQYNEVAKTFFRDGDWKHYEAGIGELLLKFRVGWQNAAAVKMLADKVAAHRSSGQSPRIEGEGLTEADRKLAEKLLSAAAKPERSHFSRWSTYRTWTLGRNNQSVPETRLSDEAPSVLDTIKSQGMKSVPLLIAMLEDTTFTHTSLQAASGGGSSSFSYSSSDGELSEREVREMYGSLNRPATRGEIARELLESVVIIEGVESYRLDEIDTLAFKDHCSAWYEEFKDKPTRDLALAYFKRGFDSQKREAMDFLIDNEDEADVALIEGHFIEKGADSIYEVQQYVQRRGPKAKDFVERFAVAVTGDVAEADSDMFQAGGRSEDDLERRLAAMRKIANAKPAKEILAGLVAGTTTYLQERAFLRRQLGRESKTNAMTMVLDTALAVDDPTLRGQLIGVASSMGGGSDYFMRERPAVRPLKPAMHAKQWQALLEDKRLFDDLSRSGLDRTVADLAAWAVETCYGGREDQGDVIACYRLDGKALEAVRQRAAARLAGKSGEDLPKLPAADEASPESLAAAEKKLMDCPAEELGRALDSLAASVQLALPEAVASNSVLNARLKPLAQRVVHVRGVREADDLGKAFEKGVGKPLSRAMIDKLITLCRETATAGRAVGLTVLRHPSVRGVSIVITETPEAEKDPTAEMAMLTSSSTVPKGSVTAWISGVDGSASASWTLAEPAETREGDAEKDEFDAFFEEAAADLEAEVAEKEAAAIKRFWTAVDTFCDGGKNVAGMTMITVQGRPAPKEEEDGE